MEIIGILSVMFINHCTGLKVPNAGNRLKIEISFYMSL